MSIAVAAPPWSLTGDGFIWLFKFSRTFVEQNGFLAEWQRGALKHTLGAMMLVDYRETPVGPYRELLFIPGTFEFGRLRLFSISKIYVSTQASVHNGIENWGIPKELADFTRESQADGSDVMTASVNGQAFFSSKLAPFGPRLPVTSSLLPVPLRIGQQLRGDLLITQPSASGTARLCRAHDLRIDARLFPDVSQMQPLAVIAVNDFRMTFPEPDRAGRM